MTVISSPALKVCHQNERVTLAFNIYQVNRSLAKDPLISKSTGYFCLYFCRSCCPPVCPFFTVTMNNYCPLIFFLKKDFILEREEGKEKERETSMCGCLSTPPLLGTWPTTQACALTGNQTSNTSVCRPALNPLSHTSQGCPLISWSEVAFSWFS